MTVLGELEQLAGQIGADAERLVSEGRQQLQEHVTDHPQPLFDLLRTAKPVLVVHDIAIVTRYPDVIEVLRNDGAFGVAPYTGKMESLAGDFILGLDDGPEYERDVSILRLAAPRSDVGGLSDFVSQTAAGLVAEGAERDGTVDVVDLAKRVPARLIGRWLGTPGPDEDAMIAWTMPMFQDIFANVQNDAAVHDAAVRASAQLRPYLAQAIASRRRAGVGGGGAGGGGGGGGGGDGDGDAPTVLDRLIAMQGAPDTAFTDEEIATNIAGLVVGFVPTVATAIPLAIDALLDRADALPSAATAAAAGDIDTVRSYMWEAMRLAPLGPGLFRRATSDFVVGEGTMQATTVPAGTLTLAATQSAMLDGDIVDDPGTFRPGRPAHHYLHFGTGLHTCFGRFANAMQIPLIASALLARPRFGRVAGDRGRLVRSGPYPESLVVTV
jgi:cytochrome P450